MDEVGFARSLYAPKSIFRVYVKNSYIHFDCRIFLSEGQTFVEICGRAGCDHVLCQGHLCKGSKPLGFD